MEKVARIISLEFESKETKIERMAKFRSVINEVAVGIEVLLVVNTGETSAMSIQVWPDEATAQAYDERMEAWATENYRPFLKDIIKFEGDVDFWFQQIKYFGGDAIRVSGAGA